MTIHCTVYSSKDGGTPIGKVVFKMGQLPFKPKTIGKGYMLAQ